MPRNANLEMNYKDRGYAWVVLIVATITLMLTNTVSMGSLGTLYVELLLYHPSATASDVSWLGSILIMTQGITGFFVGPMLKVQSPRTMVLLGTLISSAGLLISAFVTNWSFVYFSFGALTGIGTACNTVSALVAVQNYFEKRLAFGNGMCVFALSMSTFVAPPLTVYLVHTFALPGMFMLFAGLQLQCLWLAALIRPTPAPPPDTALSPGERENESSLAVMPETQMEKTKPATTSVKPDLPQPIVRHRLVNNNDDLNPREQNPMPNVSMRTMKRLASSLGLGMFKDGTYVLFVTGIFLQDSGHLLPFVYLPLRGVGLGVSDTKAALLVTAVGISGMICRVAIGFCGDYMPLRRKYVCAAAVICGGALTAASSLLHSYAGLLIYAACFGSVAATYIVLQLPSVGDIWGREHMAAYTALTYIIFGLAAFIMSPIAAAIVDSTQTVWPPFLVFGLVEVVGGICTFLATYINDVKLSRSNAPYDPDEFT